MLRSLPKLIAEDIVNVQPMADRLGVFDNMNLVCPACTHVIRLDLQDGNSVYRCGMTNRPVNTNLNGCRDYTGPRKDDFFPVCFDFYEEFLSKEEMTL